MKWIPRAPFPTHLDKPRLETNKMRLAIAAILLVCCSAIEVEAAAIYWSEVSGPPGTHSIQRANTDGTELQVVVPGCFHLRGMAFDIVGQRIYWMELGLGKMRSANLDGSGVSDVVAIDDGGSGVVIDSQAGKVYWTDCNNAAINSGQITGRVRRANLDGTNVEDLVTQNLVHPVGIALDALHGKVYWTNLERNFDGLGKIQRSNLDGTNVEDVLTGIDEANGLAIDVASGQLYWTELRAKAIQRCNLDGSALEDVVTGVDWPTNIALDIPEQKMYWTNAGPGTAANFIQSANLDGTDVETVLSGSFSPWGIAVLPEPSSSILVLAGIALIMSQAARRSQLGRC